MVAALASTPQAAPPQFCRRESTCDEFSVHRQTPLLKPNPDDSVVALQQAPRLPCRRSPDPTRAPSLLRLYSSSSVLCSLRPAPCAHNCTTSRRRLPFSPPTCSSAPWAQRYSTLRPQRHLTTPAAATPRLQRTGPPPRGTATHPRRCRTSRMRSGRRCWTGGGTRRRCCGWRGAFRS